MYRNNLWIEEFENLTSNQQTIQWFESAIYNFLMQIGHIMGRKVLISLFKICCII